LSSRFLSERFIEQRLFPALLLIIMNVKVWISLQYRIAGWDGYIYLLNARRFLYGYDPYSYFELLRPPFVPYLISLLWTVTGENYSVAIVLQAIFTAAAGYVMFLLVKEILGVKAALIASLAMLVIPDLFMWTDGLLIHGEGLFFDTVAVYALWRGLHGHPEYYPVSAFSLALGTLARYTNLALVPAMPMMLLSVYWLSRGPRKISTSSLYSFLVSTFRRFFSRNSRNIFWIWIGIVVFVATWLPWLAWNQAGAGNPLASLYSGLFTAEVFLPPSAYTPIYFYVTSIPAWLGIPGAILLVIGLVDRKTLRDKGLVILLLWMLTFLIFQTVVSNRQTRFYIEWTPALTAFMALGFLKIEQRLPRRTKVLAWALVALTLASSFVIAVNNGFVNAQSQEISIINYDEFNQVVSWIKANTNHTTIGATDLGPYFSYNSNRLFYDMGWIPREAADKNMTVDQTMKWLNVTVIVLTRPYVIKFEVSNDPNLVVVQSFPDYLIFEFKK
jgi:4-amino-4-deoxy-L-arabinose transferase-like glycosyltransferase